MRHIGFPVTEIDRSLQFYMGYLGFEFVCTGSISAEKAKKLLNRNFEFNYYKLKYPSSPNTLLELYYIVSETIRKSSAGLHCSESLMHYALTVSNIHQYWDRFKDTTYCVSSELMEIDNHKLFFIKDPDGVLIELVEKVDG